MQIKAFLAVNQKFAVLNFLIFTRRRPTAWQAKHFTRIMQREYLMTAYHLRKHTAGGVYLNRYLPGDEEDQVRRSVAGTAMMQYKHVKIDRSRDPIGLFCGRREIGVADGVPLLMENLYVKMPEQESSDEEDEERMMRNARFISGEELIQEHIRSRRSYL